ncbi:hypothetical protein J1614_009915 [Plenodomus biglobosus]|nr:hypothetical protein J1614_009915 [Plenodomus biglobosus]
MVDKATEIVTNNKPDSDLRPQFRQTNADTIREGDPRLLIRKNRRNRGQAMSNWARNRKKNRRAFLCALDQEPTGKAEPERHDSFKCVILEDDIQILWPLSSTLQTLLRLAATATGDV